MADLESQLSSERKRSESLQQELEQVRAQSSQAEAERRKMADEFRIERLKLVDQVRSLQTDLDTCNDSLDECANHEQQLHDENTQLQAQLVELQEQLRVGDEALTSRGREVGELRKRCREIEIELEDLQMDFEANHLAQSQRPTVTSQTSASHRACVARACQTATPVGAGDDDAALVRRQTVTIEQLKVEILNLKDQIADRDDEIDVMRLSLRDGELLRTEYEELESELADKDAIISGKQQLIDELQVRVDAFDAELKAEVSKKDDIISKLEQQVSERDRRIEEMTSQIEDLETEVKRSNDVMHELESRVFDLNVKLESFRTVVTQKDQQLDALINRRRDASQFKDRNLLMLVEEKKEEIGRLQLKVKPSLNSNKVKVKPLLSKVIFPQLPYYCLA